MPDNASDAGPIRDFDAGTAAPSSTTQVHDRQLAELYEAGQRRALAWQLFFLLASGISVISCAYAQSRRR